jgi:hypothetical protein
MQEHFLIKIKRRRKSRWRIDVDVVLFLKNFSKLAQNRQDQSLLKKYVMTKKSKMAAENQNGGKMRFLTEKSTETPPTEHTFNSF